MNWKLKVIWIALTLSAVNMIACGQKKEENNGRPPLAAGVTAGKNTPATNATVVSTMPVQVDEKLYQASIANITALKNTSEEDIIAQISLEVILDNQVQKIILQPKSTDPERSFYESGDYTITYTSVCTAACAKLYFVAKITNHVTKKDQSQIAVVRLMDGTKFSDNETQKSLSNMGEKNIKSVEEMIKLLDQATTPATADTSASKNEAPATKAEKS